MPTTEQIIKEFFEDDIGHVALDALDALRTLETDAVPGAHDWFALHDALGCCPDRDDKQELLYRAATAMFMLQQHYNREWFFNKLSGGK